MLSIKTMNEIIMNIINNIHDSLPDVDIKEGTFLRDVIINPVSKEFSDIYNKLYKMELAQSVLTATGADLDRLAANYFIQRKTGTGSTGKVRFYITNTHKDSMDAKYPDIKIAKGTIVATHGSVEHPSLTFKTVDDILIYGNGTSKEDGDLIITTGVLGLPRDHTGYRYIEIVCESIETGTKTNVGPHTIVSQINHNNEWIHSVNNPFSFNGGSDAEDDISLALRIGLAITGSNIGTKDGYLSYILQQPQVLDAIVVDAGHEYMQRDIITIVDENTGELITEHMGGKVDIYVRTNSTSTDEFSYKIGNDDLNNEFQVPRKILFPTKAYPIESITSIVGQRIMPDNSISYVSYVNADNYELEKKSDNNGNYYVDILWDFSIKNYFPDNQYYPLPLNLSETEITRLKSKLDDELKTAMQYLENISYKIQWDFIEWIDGNEDETISNATTLFNFGRYTDNLFYKLQMKSTNHDANMLGGRIFIMKENKIYVRAFITPDFKIVRDGGNFTGSVKSKDYIQWFPKNSGLNMIHVPVVGERLNIKYVNNSGIRDLQDGMEIKRVLTADVLVKAAKQKDIEVKLNVRCSAIYDSDEMRATISAALSHYVNSRKKLGGYVDQSDIVYIVKSIDGVVSVEIDSIGLSFVGSPYMQTLTCNPDEYFYLKNLILNISNTGII